MSAETDRDTAGQVAEGRPAVAPTGAQPVRPPVSSGNLADLVRAAAARRPDHPALLYSDRTFTWAELDGLVDRAAAGLLALGLVPGDRVALVLDNTPDFPIAYFGTIRAGLVSVPLSTQYTPDELAYPLGDSAARAVVSTRLTAGPVLAVTGQLPALEHVLVAGVDEAPAGARTLDDLLASGGEHEVAAGAGGEDLAVLMYTSGTSGRPKGAMLSHRALLGNLDQTAAIRPPVATDDDVMLLVLPLFHIYGLNAGLGVIAQHGATGVLVERFDPAGTLATIVSQQVTNILGAPPMYVAWSMMPDISGAFSTVRLAVSGAAPLPGSVLRRVLNATGHHVFEGYGLTETSPVLTSTLMSEVAKPESIGRPLPGVELRLLDEVGDDVEDGDPGEITVRGVNLFSGYWPDGRDGPDAEGWFRTGDLAFHDVDGDLRLVDRRRELILVSGFNVYPREVEEVLLGHPDITDAAVLGIAHPYTGQSVKALVVLRAGARLSTEDVIEHCARHLARFKCPTAVEFAAELPHSATGKVAKGRLREAAARAAGAS